VTLDDVSCLTHLPIDGMLLSHELISRDDAMDMMIQYLGSYPGDVLDEVTEAWIYQHFRGISSKDARGGY